MAREDRRTRHAARLAALVAGCAAILYSAWLIAPLLNPGHDAASAYVSELSARDQPFTRLFRGFDAAAGLALAVAVGVLLWRDRRSGRMWRRNGPFVALGLFGLATFADAMLPLSCAPTSDAICAVEERLGLLPLTHQLHVVSSSLAGGFALVSLVWATARLWRRRRDLARGAGPDGTGTDGTGTDGHGETVAWLMRLGGALALVHTIALAYTLAEIAGHGVGGLGTAQRISLAALAVWWVLVFLTWRRGAALR